MSIEKRTQFLRSTVRTGIAVAVMLAGASAVAQTAELSSRARSVVFLDVIATRGVECGLLEAWQGLALRTQMSQEIARLTPEQRTAAAAAASEKAAETACDSPSITQWVGAAKPNFETEMLPPFLLVYRAMAQRDPRPTLFIEATTGVDVANMLAAIEAKITEFAGSGSTAFEGGKSWAKYRAHTDGQIQEAMDQALGPDTPDSDQIRRMFVDAISIVHLWRETR